LVDKYEEERFPIDNPDPIEAIKFRMEQLGYTTSDLATLIGGKNRVSEIFNKKRGLSIKMIRTLYKEWNIPADSLIGETVD
jgi:HTH-type transcriptional regulator/antitoxin HigA